MMRGEPGSKLLLVLSSFVDENDGLTLQELTAGGVLTRGDVNNASVRYLRRLREDGGNRYYITVEGLRKRDELQGLEQPPAQSEAGLALQQSFLNQRELPEPAANDAATRAATPELLPLPQVKEIDIDAVHRLYPAARGLAAPAAHADPDAFDCAISHKGVLTIESGAHRLELPLAHTRKLVRYLEHTLGSLAEERARG
ncbi:MAG: hypothetical protein HS128_19330 [Ideonella sp.]|nr:hypothetical protein [Ideonella sp.]MCC7455956.1 hypothetical protein [Nitrospira sp.]